MNKIVKKDVLAILKSMVKIISDDNLDELKPLSDQTIHCACIFQDEDSISIAVMTYALYKVYTRNILKDFNVVFPFIKKATHYLSKNDLDQYRANITLVFKAISRYDGQLKSYVEEVINKSKLNKGCKMVEHGLSIARASELMRISQWELMSYMGKTNVPDILPFAKSGKKRLDLARKLFA